MRGPLVEGWSGYRVSSKETGMRHRYAFCPHHTGSVRSETASSCSRSLVDRQTSCCGADGHSSLRWGIPRRRNSSPRIILWIPSAPIRTSVRAVLPSVNLSIISEDLLKDIHSLLRDKLTAKDITYSFWFK